MRFLGLVLVSALLGTSAVATDADFGTQGAAKAILAQISQIIQAGGVDAGIAAMHDGAQPFSTSQLGIHIFEDGIIVADNREPELIATFHLDVEDFTGEAMWPRIVAAADASEDAILEWFHYDTEAEYTYACHSEWAEPGKVIIMFCR